MHKNLRNLGGALGISVLSMCTIGCYKSSCEDTGTCGPYYEPPPGYCVNLDAPEGERLYLCDAGAGADAGTDVSMTGDAMDAGDASLPSDGSLPIDGGNEPAVEAEPPCNDAGSPSTTACLVDEKYGVFVSASATATPDGTKTAPFKTITAALAQAQGKNIYVCAGQYAENITINAAVDGARIFGGFDCTSWSYAAVSRPVVKPATGLPLTIQRLTKGVTIEDVEFDAPATAAKGESSVAAFVISSQGVKLTRVKLMAADAQPGPDAMATSNYDATIQQNDPKVTGSTATNAAGGPQQQCGGLCTDGTQSSGGKGGNGSATAPAQNGNAGTPPIVPASPLSATGQGGTGETSVDACSNGKKGSDAPPAVGGIGAAKSGFLTSSGWTAANGAPGTNGGRAQAGGGGGGGVTAANQGGGGGGGCGGCGGAGGPGGKTGGSSFAVLSYQSTVSLDTCILIAGKAGNGGNGADGQVGQLGGFGGGSSLPGCNGGNGGQGGQAGGGGGGAGGLSVAIGYAGTAPTQSNGSSTTQVASPVATGGLPGTGGVPAATKGADGQAISVLLLESGAAGADAGG